MLRLYWIKGRDRKYKDIFHEPEATGFVSPFEKVNPVMTFAPPKDLSPGEVGVLVDERVDMRDITAIAIDLARRGFFRIKEIEKGRIFKKRDFELTRTSKDESELLKFEKNVLDMLFGERESSLQKTVKLSKPDKNAYKFLPDIKNNLYEHMHEAGYFSGNPSKVRNKYIIVSFLVGFIFIFFGSMFTALTGTVGVVVAGIMSAVIIVIFGIFMPARTAKGRQSLMDVVGLKEYVRLGAWRQKKYESWNFFEEILPYTIAFGLTHKFINAFKDIKLDQPEWYLSQGVFSALYFSDAMDSFSSSMVAGVNSTRPKSSASGGGSGFSGGSSGGGFGGGGGGSW